MKKMLSAVSLLLCAAALIAAGTIAYSTVETNVDSHMNMDGLDFVLHETDGAGKEVDPDSVEEWLLPGNSYDYSVYAENVCSQPMFMRARVEFEAEARPGMNVSGEDLIRAKENAGKAVGVSYNTEEWTYKDGWWYCGSVLNPGMNTADLFKAVSFDAGDMGNEYRGVRIRLVTRVEAVQVKNNGSSSLTALGWDSN